MHVVRHVTYWAHAWSGVAYSYKLVAILYWGLATTLYSLLDDIVQLVGLVSFTSFLFLGACAAGLFVLRWKQPGLERPYRAPLVFPALFLLFCAVVFLTPFFSPSWWVNLAMLGVLLLGVSIYWVLVKNCFNIAILPAVMMKVRDLLANVLNCE